MAEDAERRLDAICSYRFKANENGLSEETVFLLDQIDARDAALRETRAEVAEAGLYLRNILRGAAPQCKPFTRLPNTCMQIDNLVAGQILEIARLKQTLRVVLGRIEGTVGAGWLARENDAEKYVGTLAAFIREMLHERGDHAQPEPATQTVSGKPKGVPEDDRS